MPDGLSAFLPIRGRGGKYSIATRRLGRAVQSVCGRPPNRIVRGCPVRFQRGFVPVNFKEVVDVRVLLVAQNVEAQAAWLIPFGAQGIRLDRLEETLALLWL